MKIKTLKFLVLSIIYTVIISVILFLLHRRQIDYNFWTKDFILALVLGFIASMPNFFKAMHHKDKKHKSGENT